MVVYDTGWYKKNVNIEINKKVPNIKFDLKTHILLQRTRIWFFTLLSTDLEEIRQDVLSKLWCTYRRGFVEIGGEEITSDKGWGCKYF